jgi:ABC-type glycerol-3-phosphate transport system permease component
VRAIGNFQHLGLRVAFLFILSFCYGRLYAFSPIYWTITTSFKMAPDVMKGNIIPWVDFTPKWLGWRSLGLSPETIGIESTVREEFLKRFWNSAIVSVCSSILAVGLGSCAAYGLSRFNYRFGFMRNSDISFFFLSQLILPPVVLALPFLVLYKSSKPFRHAHWVNSTIYADGFTHSDMDYARSIQFNTY